MDCYSGFVGGNGTGKRVYYLTVGASTRSLMREKIRLAELALPLSTSLLCLIVVNNHAFAVSDDFESAKSLFSHNRYSGALKSVDRALQRNPRRGEAWILRAQILQELERKSEALKDADKGIALEPNNPSHLEARARIKYELNDLSGAIADVTRAIALNSKEDSLYRFRAKMHILRHEDKNALSDLTRAISFQDKDNDSNYRLRADLYARLRKFDLAAADYTLAIETIKRESGDSDMLERCYASRADMYERLGKKTLAAADRKILKELLNSGWGAFLNNEPRKSKVAN